MLKDPTKRDYFSITVFYLAPSFFWAVMLIVVLQKRMEAVVPVAANLPKSMDIIVNAGGVVSIVTQVIIGAISDRHRGKHGRRRPFITVGTILSIPAIWFFALASNFPMLVVSFMLLQLSVNISSGPYQALIPDMIPPERHGIASGYMGVWNLIGQAGGLALAAVLFRGALGSHGLLYLFGAVSVLFLALTWITVSSVHKEPYAGETMKKREAMLSIFKTDLRGNPSFVWVMISRFLINLGFYTALLYLRWYLEFALKLPAKSADVSALVLALVVTGTGLLGTIPSGRLADAISKKKVVYITCVLCIVAAILFCVASNLTWALVASAIFGLGFGAFLAVDWALACNVLPEGDAAKFLGIWTFSFVVPQMAAALVGHVTVSALQGHIGEAGAYRAVFAGIVPFMVLGTIAVSRVKEKPVAREA
jgi:Na+/melibiose symporter-like transporter